MTDEQVELEFIHMDLDRKAKEGRSEEYSDPDFDDWDREMEEEDRKLSYEYDPAVLQRPNADDNDWEDVEL
ncbi:hypothetical protein [Paenibacillus durus]|uniref:Uncharacterized protein n=1 Tax=Paenibacillus durus ATCC 35681 TaxID=1333534 RepID=A0A0F7FCG7_PAEDU|nr:hypothetical protein [Paenibacillus durus]AKG36084.1 hypothetical protein VK70_17240 [Paenibacillus durus ATCC 35681]